MRRRRRVVLIGSLAAGEAAVMGTGAFTSVSASRQVSVENAGDDSALVALAPRDRPNGEYADIEDGQFTLNIPNLNGNASTRINNVYYQNASILGQPDLPPELRGA